MATETFEHEGVTYKINASQRSVRIHFKYSFSADVMFYIDDVESILDAMLDENIITKKQFENETSECILKMTRAMIRCFARIVQQYPNRVVSYAKFYLEEHSCGSLASAKIAREVCENIWEHRHKFDDDGPSFDVIEADFKEE